MNVSVADNRFNWEALRWALLDRSISYRCDTGIEPAATACNWRYHELCHVQLSASWAIDDGIHWSDTAFNQYNIAANLAQASAAIASLAVESTHKSKPHVNFVFADEMHNAVQSKLVSAGYAQVERLDF